MGLVKAVHKLLDGIRDSFASIYDKKEPEKEENVEVLEFDDILIDDKQQTIAEVEEKVVKEVVEEKITQEMIEDNINKAREWGKVEDTPLEVGFAHKGKKQKNRDKRNRKKNKK